MFNVAVYDGDQTYTEYIAAMCNSILQERLGNKGSFSVDLFSNGIDLISRHGKNICYDIIFLDFLIDNIDGMSMASAIRAKDKNVAIVYLMSSADSDLKNCGDPTYRYLMKSLTESNQRSQLENIIDQILSEKEKKKWFLFKDKTGFKRIPTENIIYLEISGRKTAIYTSNGIILYNEKLNEIKRKLNETQFIQCHQSYIVNIKYVLEIQKSQIILLNKEIIPLSRKHREEVITAFFKNFSN
jgi:two-component system response regulator LytT